MKQMKINLSIVFGKFNTLSITFDKLIFALDFPERCFLCHLSYGYINWHEWFSWWPERTLTCSWMNWIQRVLKNLIMLHLSWDQNSVRKNWTLITVFELYGSNELQWGQLRRFPLLILELDVAKTSNFTIYRAIGLNSDIL